MIGRDTMYGWTAGDRPDDPRPGLCRIAPGRLAGRRCRRPARRPRPVVRGGPGPGRPVAGRSGPAGAVVRGPRPGGRAAQAPGDGRDGRPRQRRGARADGAGLPRRPLAEARGRRRRDPGRPGRRRHPGRVRRPPSEGRLHRRRPVGPGPLVRRARPEGPGPRPPDRRDPARPLARRRLEAPRLQEARRPMGHRRPARRRAGRGRGPEAGRPPLEAGPGEVEGDARPAVEARRGPGRPPRRDRPPRRGDDRPRLRHRPRGRPVAGRPAPRPGRRPRRVEVAGRARRLRQVARGPPPGHRDPPGSRPARLRQVLDRPDPRPDQVRGPPGRRAGLAGLDLHRGAEGQRQAGLCPARGPQHRQRPGHAGRVRRERPAGGRPAPRPATAAPDQPRPDHLRADLQLQHRPAQRRDRPGRAWRGPQEDPRRSIAVRPPRGTGRRLHPLLSGG